MKILQHLQISVWAIAVAIATACCLLLCNTVGVPNSHGHRGGINMFGWPFTYATSSFTKKQLEQNHAFNLSYKTKVWFSPAALPPKGPALENFDKSALFRNILVGFGAPIVIVFLMEYRCRMLRQPNTFSLRSLLGLVALVCVFGAASRSALVMSVYLQNWLLIRAGIMLGIPAIVLWALISPIVTRRKMRADSA